MYISGVTLVITHLESKAINPVFKPILLKDTTIEADGSQVVTVADSTFRWHPNFKLYLCTSTPLFLQGKVLYIIFLPTK